MGRMILASAALYMNLIGVVEPQDSPAAAALARLRSLSGEWEGSFEWSGSRNGTGRMNATYSVTGNDSAVVESLTMGGVPTMTSVYHLDGADLRVTHYCAAQNQPRLRAQRIDMVQGVLEFSFVDATNLPSLDAAHVHGLEIRFIDADHIALTFIFHSGGHASNERIDLKRTGKKPSASSK
jgi:hypothetical protein